MWHRVVALSPILFSVFINNLLMEVEQDELGLQLNDLLMEVEHVRLGLPLRRLEDCYCTSSIRRHGYT